ncbi:MAG: bifunctional methylenetetrahydrofolate dehydrogenase/methenyltetrahydrofolate cyclohydrolase FolD [archaeon]
MAEIIDGKAIAALIREEIKKKISQFDVKPGLSVVQVGTNPASAVYVRLKQKACDEVGIISKKYELDEKTSQEELLALVRRLNADKSVHGILVQLPLPGHINETDVINAISIEKDVDGFHPINAGKLLSGDQCLVPCTPRGIIRLIESTGENIEGKRAVVVGRSNIVGKPVAFLLLDKNATVTICHSRTQNLGEITREADILIAAVGRPRMIGADMIKPGAVVIDVGTTNVDGKLVGDVDFESAKEVAGYITPVPGGVGPMTIAMLLDNTLQAFSR